MTTYRATVKSEGATVDIIEMTRPQPSEVWLEVVSRLYLLLVKLPGVPLDIEIRESL
jgi:hypothetical protein